MMIASGQDTSPQDDIIIGALVTLTGDWASNGEHTKAVLELGIKDMNRFLKDIGSDRRVVMAMEDTASDPARARELLESMDRRGIDLAIAATTSAEISAMKDYADENGMIIIGTSSTAPSLAVPGDSIFRLVTDDAGQGRVMARILEGENVSAIVPMSRGDLWGDDLLNATKSSFEMLGGTVAEGVRYDPNAANYSSDIENLSARVSEAGDEFGLENIGVYLVSFDDGLPVMAQAAKDPVLSSVRWFGSDGMAGLPVLVENESAARQATTSGFIAPVFSCNEDGEMYSEVAEAVREEVGFTPDAYAVLAYDALWIAALTELLAGDGDIMQKRTAFIRLADTYSGAAGSTRLNAAGDREHADYCLRKVVENNGNYAWQNAGLYGTDDEGGQNLV